MNVNEWIPANKLRETMEPSGLGFMVSFVKDWLPCGHWCNWRVYVVRQSRGSIQVNECVRCRASWAYLQGLGVKP
jgi:hypothetical protein